MDELLKSLLSPEELKKLQAKKDKKAGRKSTGTGVVQKRHSPYKIIHSDWKFVSATVPVHFQVCQNCGNQQTYTNNHVLFKYERTKTFRNPLADEVTLDVHETYLPRKGVRLPDDIAFDVHYMVDDKEAIAYCEACCSGKISTRHLMETLSIPYQEDEEVVPISEGKHLIVLEGEDAPQFLSSDQLRYLDKEDDK